MAQHIGEQVSLTRAWYPVAGVLLILGFVPGMPNLLFLIAAIVAGGVAYLVNRNLQLHSQNDLVDGEQGEMRLEGDAAKPEQIELSEIADNSPISIQLGYGLVDMVNEENGGTLVNRVTGIRRQVSKSLGFVVPAVRIRDDLTLEANTYRLRIGQTIVGEDHVYPDRKLAIPGENASIKIEGIEVKDPTFGMDAVWIMEKDVLEAESKGFVIVAPDSVMTTHLSQILYKYAGQLIGQDDVQSLLDNLSETAPNLVQSVVPKLVPLHQLTGVLRALLEERVPISDLRRILENLASLAGRNLNIIDTAEMLRPELAGLLIQQVSPLNQPLPVITLGSELEHMLITMARQSGEEGLVIDNTLAQQLLRKISDTNDSLAAKGRQPVVVVSPAIRKEFSKIIRQHIDDIVVLAFTELPETRKIEVVATITGEPESDN